MTRFVQKVGGGPEVDVKRWLRAYDEPLCPQVCGSWASGYIILLPHRAIQFSLCGPQAYLFNELLGRHWDPSESFYEANLNLTEPVSQSFSARSQSWAGTLCARSALFTVPVEGTLACIARAP